MAPEKGESQLLLCFWLGSEVSGQLQPREERPPASFTKQWTQKLFFGGGVGLCTLGRSQRLAGRLLSSRLLDYSPLLLGQFPHGGGLALRRCSHPMAYSLFPQLHFCPSSSLCLSVSVFTVLSPHNPIGSLCSPSLNLGLYFI